MLFKQHPYISLNPFYTCSVVNNGWAVKESLLSQATVLQGSIAVSVNASTFYFH